MIRFNKWIYVIPGFTQHRGTRTKMIDLWARLYANLGGNGTSIQCQPWCADWRSEAELICRTSEFNPEIYVIAYSWGAGWGFTQLSKQLRQRGYRINHAWLIDPVYRHNYVLGQWRALVPGIPIKVPSNVDHVTWWRQNETYPKGHDLKAKDGAGTFIDEAQWVEYAQQLDGNKIGGTPIFLQGTEFPNDGPWRS